MMHCGTTVDTFLRENLEWLSRATNWAKFSATAGLGVIHKGPPDRTLWISLRVCVCGRAFGKWIGIDGAVSAAERQFGIALLGRRRAVRPGSHPRQPRPRHPSPPTSHLTQISVTKMAAALRSGFFADGAEGRTERSDSARCVSGARYRGLGHRLGRDFGTHQDDPLFRSRPSPKTALPCSAAMVR